MIAVFTLTLVHVCNCTNITLIRQRTTADFAVITTRSRLDLNRPIFTARIRTFRTSPRTGTNTDRTVILIKTQCFTRFADGCFRACTIGDYLTGTGVRIELCTGFRTTQRTVTPGRTTACINVCACPRGLTNNLTYFCLARYRAIVGIIDDIFAIATPRKIRTCTVRNCVTSTCIVVCRFT